jgi:uncharacterized protein (DUF1501 family)
MSLSRRRLLLLGVAAPAAVALRPLAATAADAERRLARLCRPAPAGTSATRCAACGADDHTMLHAACPARRDLRR